MSIKLFIDTRGQDVTGLYEDWNWLVKPEDLSSPVLMNNFGDLFFQTNTGDILFLDTSIGVVDKAADNLPELQSMLNNPDVQDRLLFSSLVDALVAQNMVLDDNQLYSFKIPLRLGGAISVENVEMSDKSVALSVLGQIQAQIKDLAVGTKIDGMGVKNDLPNRLQ